MLKISRRCNQTAALAQIRANRTIGRVELGIDHTPLPTKPGPVFAILAIGHNCENRIDPIGLAQDEIILTMIRRHMDKPGACIGCDEITGQKWTGFGVKSAKMVHGVTGDGSGELASAISASKFALGGHRINAPARHRLCLATECNEQLSSLPFDQIVRQLWPISQSLINRYRPRRCCPDHRIRPYQFGNWRFHNLKRNINLGRGDIFILDFGFGKRCLFDRRPHHRFGPAIKLAHFGKFHQF